MKLLLLGFFFFITMSISGIYAITNQTTKGTFSTGIVDIKIQTYRLNDENQEVKYDVESRRVMPSDEISFIPKICNLGENCYVRVKVNYIDKNADFSDYVTGFSSNFKKYGEYYYYDKVLNSDETIKIFDTIKIPEDISKNTNNGKIKLEIIAQAIQEKNFEPDYTLDEPWKNITPTESTTNSYDINTRNNNSKIIIKYEDDTNNDISVPSNFFEKMNTAMPGDSFIDSIEIKNDNKKNAKYYLKINTNEKSEKEIELLNQVNLTITNKNGQVIYNGNLLSKEKILLGEYSLNGYDNLEFKISIPSRLGNEYTLLNPELSLVFSSEYDKKDSIRNIISNPKTGDSIDLAITIFFISAIGLIIVMLLAYREKKKEEC